MYSIYYLYMYVHQTHIWLLNIKAARVYCSDNKCKLKQDRIKTAIQLTMCTGCLIEGALFLFLISVVLISYLVLYSVSKEDVMSGLTVSPAQERVLQWCLNGLDFNTVAPMRDHYCADPGSKWLHLPSLAAFISGICWCESTIKTLVSALFSILHSGHSQYCS